MIVDYETESCVLGCMLATNEIIPNVESTLCVDDFHAIKNQMMYRKISELYAENKCVDIIMLTNSVDFKDPVYIASLTDTVATGWNWEFYCTKLKKTTLARKFEALVKTECEGITVQNAGEKLQRVIEEGSKISDTTGGKKIRKMQDIITPILQIIDEALTRKTPFSGFETGLKNLDAIIDGLQREYCIIGARPSIGKSAIAMQIGKNIALKNVPVGYFSLEMSGESLGMRTLSSMSNVSDRALRSGLVKQSAAVWQRINDGCAKMYEFPFYVVDRIKGDLNEIKALCRQFVRCYNVQVIFIDHISLVKSNNKNLPRYEQYTEISNELQQLQRELKCSIVAVMQLGRGSEGKLPTLADLRESGSFEQDADCIMLLHRERVGEKNETKQFIDTSLFVAKNRNGACGVARLEFEPAYVRFRDKIQ